MSSSTIRQVNADGSLEVADSASIKPTIHEVIQLADTHRRELTFEFNEVYVAVRGDSDPDLILRDWRRAMDGCIEGTVGPYPQATLSPEDRESDQRARDKKRRQLDRKHTQKLTEDAAQRSRVTALLRNAPPMEFSKEGRRLWESWQAVNTDRTGQDTMHFAERWARLMQLRMARGKTLRELYYSTSQEADFEGMSGATGGAAEAMLVRAWVHGEELRRVRDTYRGRT